MFVGYPETKMITSDTLKSDAKKFGFDYQTTSNHQYVIGRILGQDFKVDTDGELQSTTVIRVFGGLSQHENELKNLAEGQEIFIATVNKIEHFAEYVDKDSGYVDYSVVKKDGQLMMKIFGHAPVYISSVDKPSFMPLHDYIEYWTNPSLSLGGFSLSQLN